MGYPIFPNVPDLPGVPQLLRFPSSSKQLASVAGAVVGNTLSVSSLVSGALFAGSQLNAPGLISGTTITQQLTGAVGGIGTYALNAVQTFAGNLAAVFTPPSFLPDDLVGTDSLEGFQDQAPQWGIYKDQNSVVAADNIVTMGFRQDFDVSTFPVEEGGFEPYNKVYVPYDVRLRFTAGGSLSNRENLLSSIAAIVGDLERYDVVTPETTYTDVNVIHQDYQRTAQDGVGLIKIDVWLLQVKKSGQSTFSATSADTQAAMLKNSKSFAGNDAVNDGTLQATPPTPQQISSLPSVM